MVNRFSIGEPIGSIGSGLVIRMDIACVYACTFHFLRPLIPGVIIWIRKGG
jgi:hypothetical protein